MIKVENLTLRLGGATVLDNLSLAIAPGRVTAIVGANGAGKTSLIRTLAGLVAPDVGTVLLDDVSIEGIVPNERAKRIGYLSQNGEPAWNVTARELVSLGRLPHRSRFAGASSADSEIIDQAMAATDTARFADRTLDTLSGGEKARVKIARVFAGQPRWILADEPLANLDPPHQRDTLALFKAAAESGTGVITVLHQLDAAAAADDAVILSRGKLVAAGVASQVLNAENLDTAFGMRFEIIEHRGRIAILPT